MIYLKNRILLEDGTNIVDPENVVNLLLHNVPINKINVTELNFDVTEFNKRSLEEIKLYQESEIVLDKTWLIPKEYLDIDLKEYFLKLVDINDEGAIIRIENELVEVYRLNFENGLKTIIYVFDQFKKVNQIWGVGRGSSCASYLLYLIGVHCVNPRKYNIHWSEFFHE